MTNFKIRMTKIERLFDSAGRATSLPPATLGMTFFSHILICSAIGTTPNTNAILGSFLAGEFGFLVSVFGGGMFYGCVDLSAY
jgi:hypothetical protein